MPDTTVVVTGNCTSEPEQKFSQSGVAVASFSVAVTSRRKNASGEWENGDTSFYDVTCFNRLAENVSESVRKGQRVVVAGQLKQSKWEKDGQARSKIEIIADEVGLSLRWDSISSGGSSAPARKPANVVDDPF